MKNFFSTALVALSLASIPASAIADPRLINARPHAHFIILPDGDVVPVGPDICDDPDLQEAFNQFHFNVHHSGTLTTPIDTLGPQHGAPGLHDGQGADLIATVCG